jgi:uncharacterized protein
MPKLARDAGPAGPVVRGFAGGGFVVDGVTYAAGLKLTPERAIGWDAPALDALGVDDLADLLALAPSPEFILIGTGAALRRPPRELVTAIEALGIGIEAMDSRAAARTWGVLRAEDRWIAAALLPLV